jgi:hypothetical protein
MPLHMPDPPPSMPDMVRSKIRDFADQSHFSTEALRSAKPDQLDVSTPHQIFTIGLDDLTSGGGLDKARPVGWRYIVEEAGQPIASAETTPSPDGTTHVLSHFNEGPFVGATATTVRAARALPQVEAAGFDLRLLRIPALYLMALWLHSPATDLLIPLAPSPIGKEGQIVPVAELMSELSRRARPTNRPGGPGTPDTHAP